MLLLITSLNTALLTALAFRVLGFWQKSYDNASIGAKNARARLVGTVISALRAKVLNGGEIVLTPPFRHKTLFIFILSSCDICKKYLDRLNQTHPALLNSGIETFIVSSEPSIVTHTWLAKFNLTIGPLCIPVLVSLKPKHTLATTLNPNSTFPSFVLLDLDGRVSAQGLVGSNVWRDEVLSQLTHGGKQ